MTAIGKMMVIFVFLLSLVWAGLVVNTWATRTNWKAEADKQNKLAKENYEGAKSLSEQAKADRSASDARVAALQANVERLQQQLTEQRDQYTKLYTAYDTKLRADLESDKKVSQLMVEITKLQNQVDLQSANLKTMEVDLNAQTRVTESNKNQKEEAVRSANAEKQRADLHVDRLQKLEEELAVAKLGGKGNLRPLPPDAFRGTVVAFVGKGTQGLIEMTPGLNAGLKPGTLLRVLRRTGNKNYIGTILIGEQVDPDRAVGTWTAPYGVKVPKGDDFPKPGDEIVPMK